MDEKTPNRSGYTRRDVFKASAGAAAALAAAGAPIIATAGPALADTQGRGHGHGGLRVEPLIPQKNRGMILYSVRDRITAAPDNTGVPYGFAQVLEAVAKCGYSEVEFAGYTQHESILGRQITPQEIRKLLDDNGLIANGTHTTINPATFEQQMDIAQTLGMRNIGTGADPTGSRYKSDWDAAADVW